MAHHYTLGAGMVGCLYDYGPNFHTTREDALEDAQWWLEADLCGDEDEQAAFDAEVSEALQNLQEHGIHYFSAEMRPTFGDYIEISKHTGPCPDADDEV